jgi:ureidoacrylate peracid hydrolase
MNDVIYDQDRTGLVVIDPYNDFISEGGKVWDRLKAVAEANNCVPHMSQVLDAARSAGIRISYALHHRYRPGDHEDWKYIADPESSVVTSDVRIRHVGWAAPSRVRAAAG